MAVAGIAYEPTVVVPGLLWPSTSKYRKQVGSIGRCRGVVPFGLPWLRARGAGTQVPLPGSPVAYLSTGHRVAPYLSPVPDTAQHIVG
eukprot:3205386-Rhodomonas_salina.2